jgi:hypothetical protein
VINHLDRANLDDAIPVMGVEASCFGIKGDFADM